MPSDVSGTELINFILVNDAMMRAEHYRQEAAKFRALAEAECDGRLYLQLLELAQRYEEQARSTDPTQH